MLIPAIDILNGRCVRLYQGDYENLKIYNNSPVEQALRFKEIGFKRLHIVDLDGAKEGYPKNIDTIKEIVKIGMDVEVGGGIRDLNTIKEYIDSGVKWVILGSILAKREEILIETKDYIDNIIAAIDFKNDSFVTEGWFNKTDKKPIDFATYLKNRYNVKTFLFTDISLDGTLKGPNIEFYKNASKYVDNIIASGGVSCDKDIEKLIRIDSVKGIIAGKAIYENKIDIRRWI
ncbi:MAG TPA: HisA/HisF-related TIM barrel protein [Spirochaetota bacterium]|nr:HisA/HisF-related TIM barrel protein [Spirochaetota bacterium]HOM38826.1 HisA/HisF-related TIM barrel protein [Spirochaetota bacterium]HPQ49884.1 HisA/HisF-related TIM barrel protein [Spirochaetota bacterium]